MSFNDHVSPQMIVIPWYRKKDWPKWLEIADEDMCPTFEAWESRAQGLLNDCAKKGAPATIEIISPTKFLRWLSSNKIRQAGAGRVQFASEQFAERMKDYEGQKLGKEQLQIVKRALRKASPEIFAGIFDPFFDRAKASSCPVFRLRDDQPEQFGTGTLLKLGKHHFMLTASHVLDEILDGEGLVPGNLGWPFLSGYVVGTKRPCSGSRKDDKDDVGILRLDEDVVSAMHTNLEFLEGPEIDGIHETEERGAYVVVGFPAERTNFSGAKLNAHPFTFSGDGVTDHRYDKLGRSPELHMLIQHRQKKAIHYQTMRQGVRLSFEGVSGGGVFAWDKIFPHPMGFMQPKLVAIVNEYNPHWGVFVATKLSCYLKILHDRYPDLPLQKAKAPQ